ncbi:MAG: hypothetical protein NC124_04610 [Clostridium sp.]|nr:hypothetical protein [Clostridium sp.]
MKKLFKQEWKYYLFFLLVLTGLLIVRDGGCYWLKQMVGWEDPIVAQREHYWVVEDALYGLRGIILYGFFEGILVNVLAGILLVKSVFFWLEKERSEREFICTLPVKRIDRMAFHLLMDSLLVIISVSVYAVYLYYRLHGLLGQLEIGIPWLASSIFGIAFTCITYLLFLLGLINVLESLFASGFVRIIGTVGGICAGNSIIELAFTLNERVKWLQKLYGYLKFKSAGGSYYQPESVYDAWQHKPLDYMVYYQGELVEGINDKLAVIDGSLNSDISRLMVAFTHVDSYIGYVLSYLVLAVLFALAAAYLVKRQENSKSEFYFKAGRYMVCAELSGLLTLVMLMNAVAAWHKCLIVFAGVILYILLNYAINTDRKKYFKSGKMV